MKASLLRAMAIAWMSVSVACHSGPPPDPLALDGGILTVDNRTSNEWTNVEIWLNTYYRITASSIPAGGRLQAPLDVFVAGYGQRFDWHRTQIRDLRLTAKLPGGKPLELTKQFQASGLAGVLGGKTR